MKKTDLKTGDPGGRGRHRRRVSESWETPRGVKGESRVIWWVQRVWGCEVSVGVWACGAAGHQGAGFEARWPERSGPAVAVFRAQKWPSLHIAAALGTRIIGGQAVLEMKCGRNVSATACVKCEGFFLVSMARCPAPHTPSIPH